ncbi:unnamed protein product [Lathyrus oleraceus]
MAFMDVNGFLVVFKTERPKRAKSVSCIFLKGVVKSGRKHHKRKQLARVGGEEIRCEVHILDLLANSYVV